MQGTVKFYDTVKGFGFVTQSDGSEIYFSSACLPRDRKYDPLEGDRVSYEIREANRGKVAIQIEFLPT